MNVKNKSCIRRLSFKQLKASKMRNAIAVFAIALTTLLFTSLFTISLSINSSFEEYQFREAGGYCHGTFKEVDDEKVEALSNHRKVKEYGLRTVCGIMTESPFAKVPAEISFMDDNCAKWSYVSLKEGHLPYAKDEIAMDTAALEKLGIPAELGAEVQLTYTMMSQAGGQEETRSDSFTLVGFWEYDKLSPVHYINVSQEYVKEVETDYVASGGVPFRSDMNVMLASSINIRGVMESIDTDLGYQWENREAENCVRIGVNWGYSTSELGSSIDPAMILAIAVFLLLVIFTGYLIIYNIFRISVSNDVRFYGLLKTIGTTPRQLKRLIRNQALFLSVIGIPIGFLGGYVVGSVLTPVVMSTTLMGEIVKVSVSPVIFLLSGIFAVITVLLSCRRPGRMAAKVSPVEAVRYTESNAGKKKSRATRGASISHMAFANLGRSKTKTALVLLSLSLAVILLNSVYAITQGFDMEKYVSHNLEADFIVGKTDYFRFQANRYNPEAGLTEEVIDEIQNNTEYSLAGGGYCLPLETNCYITEQLWRDMNPFIPEDVADGYLANCKRRGELVLSGLLLEGLDEALFEKVEIVEGDIAPLFEKDSHNIAIAVFVDDYGNPYGKYPEIGTKLPVSYVEEGHYYDSRTGELCNEDTPEEYLEWRIVKGQDVEYNVCAIVSVPYCMGYRYALDGLEAVLPEDILARDSNAEPWPMLYLFDTPDEEAEAKAEAFLADYTAGDSSELMYESKATVREDFESFRNMFLLLGGVLSFVVGLVGILNFFNAILTGIISRRREFAMLQSVGMTGKQLKQMLVYEGVFYALGAIVLSFILSAALEPLAGHLMEGMWWFFSFRFTLLPMVFIVPVFILLGVALPLVVHHFTSRKSIVERLRENE
ncbi:MAG: ABC transporter permease [Lachnospiraceae bacterium]|nr:ABC transporter permease [Lachnospiraceae bacterium]